MTETAHVVAIVVDPEFGDRVDDLLSRMPVWMADTKINRVAADRVGASRADSGHGASHTAIGALTTFTVDANATPESWCIGILDTVAGHHDHYSHSPGYSAVEVYGATPSPALLKAFAECRLTQVTALSEGFRASTPDGQAAASPNDF
ncbi:MAG: hypothetical protein WBC51_14325 [Vicinamibacterales bacterium]